MTKNAKAIWLGLLIFAFVLMLTFGSFALLALIFQACWNAGLIHAVTAAGGSLATISWTTAFDILVILWLAGAAFTWSLSGVIRKSK